MLQLHTGFCISSLMSNRSSNKSELATQIQSFFKLMPLQSVIAAVAAVANDENDEPAAE